MGSSCGRLRSFGNSPCNFFCSFALLAATSTPLGIAFVILERLSAVDELLRDAPFLVYRSDTFALDAEVVAVETGCLGLELRRGGEYLGNGAFTTALSVWLGSAAFLGLYRRGDKVAGGLQADNRAFCWEATVFCGEKGREEGSALGFTGETAPFRGPISEALRVLIGIWEDGEKTCAVGESSLCDLECEATPGDSISADGISGDRVLAECLRPRGNTGLGRCMLP
jgi:hypothetical protein